MVGVGLGAVSPRGTTVMGHAFGRTGCYQASERWARPTPAPQQTVQRQGSPIRAPVALSVMPRCRCPILPAILPDRSPTLTVALRPVGLAGVDEQRVAHRALPSRWPALLAVLTYYDHRRLESTGRRCGASPRLSGPSNSLTAQPHRLVNQSPGAEQSRWVSHIGSFAARRAGTGSRNTVGGTTQQAASGPGQAGPAGEDMLLGWYTQLVSPGGQNAAQPVTENVADTTLPLRWPLAWKVSCLPG